VRPHHEHRLQHDTTDLKRLPENEVMQLASQVQHLRHYLSASASTSSASTGDLIPVDMEEYGFFSSSQLLNLCSAVSLGLYGDFLLMCRGWYSLR